MLEESLAPGSIAPPAPPAPPSSTVELHRDEVARWVRELTAWRDLTERWLPAVAATDGLRTGHRSVALALGVHLVSTGTVQLQRKPVAALSGYTTEYVSTTVSALEDAGLAQRDTSTFPPYLTLTIPGQPSFSLGWRPPFA